MCAYVYSGQPITKQRDFEGGVYWDDLPESVVTFRGSKISRKYSTCGCKNDIQSRISCLVPRCLAIILISF